VGEPLSRRRTAWAVLHRLIALAALALGVAAVFTGILTAAVPIGWAYVAAVALGLIVAYAVRCEMGLAREKTLAKYAAQRDETAAAASQVWSTTRPNAAAGSVSVRPLANSVVAPAGEAARLGGPNGGASAGGATKPMGTLAAAARAKKATANGGIYASASATSGAGGSQSTGSVADHVNPLRVRSQRY
jgi:hypothetical protein